METFLIVGLGNPGAKYAHTRHNAGFDTVDILAQKTGIRLGKRRARAILGEGVYRGKRLVLVQPQTYMNLSGESVQPLAAWYKIDPSHLVVIYDDVDLPPGQVRVRAGGSGGTHNGMRSVIGQLGRSDFPRVRVGIGPAPAGWDIADWVISHYPGAQARKTAFDSYLRAADAALTLVAQGTDAAMRDFNQKHSGENRAESRPHPAREQTPGDTPGRNEAKEDA